MRGAAAFLLVLSSHAATAQLVPRSENGDPRLQVVDYDPAQIVQLRGAPGYQVTVELSPDEAVQSIAVGDSNAWQVSVNKSGNRFFVKPGQAPLATNMTVITSVRLYNFELIPAEVDVPYVVRVRFPLSETPALASSEYVDVSAIRRRASRYKTSGSHALRPRSITEDGQRTFIIWPKERDLPATYEIDAAGREVLTNGMMRDDVFVIDRVVHRLTFRRDELVARAEWIQPRKRRR